MFYPANNNNGIKRDSTNRALCRSLDISRFVIPFGCYLIYGEREQDVWVKLRPSPVTLVVRSSDNRRSFGVPLDDIITTSTENMMVVPEGKGRNKIRPLDVVVLSFKRGNILLSGGRAPELKLFIDFYKKQPRIRPFSGAGVGRAFNVPVENQQTESTTMGEVTRAEPALPQIDGIDDDDIAENLAGDYYERQYGRSSLLIEPRSEVERQPLKEEEGHAVRLDGVGTTEGVRTHTFESSLSNSLYNSSSEDLSEPADEDFGDLVWSINTFLPWKFIIVDIFKGDALTLALEKMGCTIRQMRREHGSAILEHTVLTGIPYPKFVVCTQVLTNIRHPRRSIASHVSATGHKWAAWMEADWKFDVHPQKEGTRVDLYYKCIRKARRPVGMVSKLVLGFIIETQKKTFVILEQRHKEAIVKKQRRVSVVVGAMQGGSGHSGSGDRCEPILTDSDISPNNSIGEDVEHPLPVVCIIGDSTNHNQMVGSMNGNIDQGHERHNGDGTELPKDASTQTQAAEVVDKKKPTKNMIANNSKKLAAVVVVVLSVILLKSNQNHRNKTGG